MYRYLCYTFVIDLSFVMVTEVVSDSVSVAAITHFHIVDAVKQQILLDI